MTVRLALVASVCCALFSATTAAATNTSLTAKAQQALASGDARGAVAAFSQAIEEAKLTPEAMAGALLNRGLAYQQIGDHQKAVDDYAAALRLDAMNPKLRATALYNRGLSYQKLKHPTLAIDDFTGALFLDSQFSHAYYARGNALRDAGQYLFALSDFEKARRYGYPSMHFAYYGEALTLEELKRPQEAIGALQQALAIKPDFPAARAKIAALGAAAPARIAAPAAQADTTVTGSLIAGRSDQIVRKPAQPAAMAPPQELLVSTNAEAPAAAAPGTVKKRYTDRIPPEEETPKQKIVVAAEPPAVAPEPEEPKVDETATASIDEAEPASEPAEETSGEPKGWSVQLASEREAKSAWSRWNKIKPRHALLKASQPIVVKADLGSRGVYYRLRLAGFDSQGAAKSACARLKSKGVSCYVSRAG